MCRADLMRPQMTATIRVTTPDEYDSAARLHPALCPLVAAGDTRCGRRLLSEAEADAARKFSGLCVTVDGDKCSGAGGEVARLVDAARAVAVRLRRLTKIPAAAASSAPPGRKKVKQPPEEESSLKAESAPQGGDAAAGTCTADACM